MSLKEKDDTYETMRTIFDQVSRSELVYVSSTPLIVL